MVLTSKDTDYQILYRLNDHDLGRMCQTNPYFRSLCSDDIFWMNRTVNRFQSILGDVENMKTYKGNRTWRNYYIDLIDKVENHYSYDSDYPKSKDWDLIRDKIATRTNSYIECYQSSQTDCSLDWTNTDFVNIGKIFWTLIKSKRLSNEEQLKLFDRLLDNPNFKITRFEFSSYLKERAVKFLLNKRKVDEDILHILRHDILRNGIDYSAASVKKIFANIEKKNIIELIESYIYHYKIYAPVLILLLALLSKNWSWTEAYFKRYYETLQEQAYFNIGYGHDKNYQDNLKVIRKYIKSEEAENEEEYEEDEDESRVLDEEERYYGY